MHNRPTPKFSVITVTYNAEAVLEDTIQSVISQTYHHVEYIIVDGASKDQTLAIAERYRDHITRIVSEPDKGLYDAMNKGIMMATGDVIGILNSDDFYTSTDILSTVADGIQQYDAVYADIHYVDPADLTRPVRHYSSAPFRRWKMRLGFMPAHPSFYCRRSVYTRFGLFDLDFKVAADFEQLLRLIYINRIFTHYIPRDFVTMRTGGASSSGFQSHKRILRDHLRAYKKNDVPSNLFLESLRYAYRVVEKISFSTKKILKKNFQ